MVLSKILQHFFQPLPIALLLLVIAWFLLERRRKVAKACFWTSIVLFLFLSNRMVSHVLLAGIEDKFPTKPLAEYPEVDLIVILGGSLSVKMTEPFILEENSGSRLVPGLQLFRLGKAKQLLVSGGNPYVRQDGVRRSEADDMGTFLESLGVPKEVIIKEGRSRNTEENAKEVAKEIEGQGWEKILLVTSAFHMRRAEMLFRKAGVEVIPVPVARKGMLDPRKWYLFLIPSSAALEMSGLAIKEHLGYIWGRLKL